MKITGLITEYNPFHNGHLYHLNQARELTSADYVIAVMSGDFVQRGAPAIFSKHTRTRMALLSGVDVVLELPNIYAISSAEDFAAGAVALLDRLGTVNTICFGSECGNLRSLEAVANILLKETPEYSENLKEYLRCGFSYPAARARAINDSLAQKEKSFQIINSPNNILGIEYLKALKKRRSVIKPVTITRAGSGYHDLDLGTILGSASAIRHAIQSGISKTELNPQFPPLIPDLIASETPIWANDISGLINQTLLSLVHRTETLTDYLDVSRELEARIRRFALDFGTYEDRIRQLKTRQYTYTRISRALLHLALGVRCSQYEAYKSQDYISYARVLGFRKDSAPVLTQLKKHANVPLVTKTADAGRLLTPTGIRMLEQDFYASHIYQSILQSKTGLPPVNEFNQPVVIL